METEQIKNTAFSFLSEKERLTAVIGSCSEDGSPHGSTVYYFVDREFNFFFLTATNTQKYKNLLGNPKSSVVVGFGPAQVTIQGQGTAVLLERASEEEKVAVAQIKRRLQDHDNETWPVFQLDAFDAESVAIFKFTPQSLQLLNLEHDNELVLTPVDVVQII